MNIIKENEFISTKQQKQIITHVKKEINISQKARKHIALMFMDKYKIKNNSSNYYKMIKKHQDRINKNKEKH